MTRRAHSRGYAGGTGMGAPEIGGSREARKDIQDMADKLVSSAGLQVLGVEKNIERAEKDLMWVCERVAKVRDALRERMVGFLEMSATGTLKASVDKFLPAFTEKAVLDVLQDWDVNEGDAFKLRVRARIDELLPEVLERVAREVLEVELAEIKARIGGKR